MSKIRAVFIDSINKTVSEGFVASLGDLQKAVDGYIERGTTLDNGDEVYVDEEGLIKGLEEFFYIPGAHQPFAGSAVIVGQGDENGDFTDAKSTVEEIKKSVQFMSSGEVFAFLHREDDL